MNKGGLKWFFGMMIIGVISLAIIASAVDFGDQSGQYGYSSIQDFNDTDILVRNILMDGHLIVQDNAGYELITDMGPLDTDFAHRKFVLDNAGSTNITDQELFTAYINASFNMGSTFVDLTNWNSTVVDTPYTFNETSGVITFNDASRYLIMADVRVTGASGRSTVFIQILEDFGSGFTTNQRLLWSNYVSRNSANPEGGLNGIYIKDYIVGDKIKIQVKNIDTNPDIPLDNARFYIIKMQGLKGSSGNDGSNGINGTDGTNGSIGPTGAGSNIIVQKDNVTIGTLTDTLNFEGAGVESVTDAGNNKTTVIISGGGSTIFGSEFEVFKSLSQSNTGSGSFQSKLDNTTASKPAGTYRITFYADVAGADGGNTFNVRYSVDGTSISPHSNGPDYYTMEQKNVNDWQTLTATQYKVLTNTTTIDLDVEWSNGDGNTARISNVVVEIWRVA